MQNVFKQFAAKGTDSSNQFHLTRLKLTAIYAVILLIILTTSSLITHSLFSTRLQHRFEGRPPAPRPPAVQLNETYRTEVREELIMTLLISNGALYLVAVGASYVLAAVTLEPIKKSYQRQQQFFSDASHELRTPLAILQTDLENQLTDPKISKANKEDAKSNLEEVEHMSKLVADLLLISRLDSLAHPEMKSMNLQQLLDTAINRLQKYANKQHIKIINHTGDTAVTITGNYEHLLHAITNIIKNAIEYNQAKGTVTVALTTNQRQAHIVISDTGPGIPKEEIPNLTRRFYRADSSRSRHTGGSGLGLAITHKIIQQHHGQIKIESKLNKGTKVTISLPV